MARTIATARQRAPARGGEIPPQLVAEAVRLHNSGMRYEAEMLYRHVLAIKPNHFDALHLLGVLRQQQGDSAEALRLLDAALQIVPHSADARSNRGVALKSLGRLDEALASYDAALAINPRHGDALVNRARVLLALGRVAEALAVSDKALSLYPDNRRALVSKGNALFKLERGEEALASFERVLKLAPNDADALFDLAVVLQSLHRYAEALARFTAVVEHQPDHVDALSNRGFVLLKLDRPTEAIADFDRALALRPDHVESLNNRGVALCAHNRYEAAQASFERAIALDPDGADLHHHVALIRLTLGDFAAGWRRYEWRWKSPRWDRSRRNFKEPQWSGTGEVAGRTVLLHAEQGAGDTLQFVRYAPLLARRGARVVVEVQRPLQGLLAQLPAVTVIARGDPLPAFDLHCPLMSLPLAFGAELATIPCEVPYLRAPESRLARWRDRLDTRNAPRVGVIWAGSPTHENDRNRSIAFDRFSRLFAAPGVGFVSLQRDMRLADAALVRAHGNVLDLGDELADFADTAAIVSQLDLVVSVDTAVAHLAGAMGKPVWILLPFSPDFRWMLGRDDSPWYPTARLFRQPAVGDWESPLAQVRSRLTSIGNSG